MLKFGLIIGVGAAFLRLAKKYNKLPWLFGILGGGLSIMFMTVVSVILLQINPQSLTTESGIVD